jgi:hypothetical protein
MAVFIHGGGWIMGNTNIEVAACRRISKSSGMKVASIGYRLAVHEKSRSMLRKHVILQEEFTIVKEYSQTAAVIALLQSQISI